MTIRLLLTISAISALASGCVKAVMATVGTAVDAGAGAAKAGVSVAGAAADMAVPDGDTARHHGHDGDPRPYDETRDAMSDVDTAFAAAAISGRKVLLALGGNWCHDSRGLAAKFQEPELAAVIRDSYELVWVDVGRRDRNLNIPARFGVPQLFGTPTVLILSPEGALLNRDSVHDWRTADSKPYDETLAYFRRFAGASQR